MVLENITDIQTIELLLKRMSTLSAIFQAIGGLILAYIVFSVINAIINKKKRNELRRMRILLERIDENIGKLAGKSREKRK